MHPYKADILIEVPLWNKIRLISCGLVGRLCGSHNLSHLRPAQHQRPVSRASASDGDPACQTSKEFVGKRRDNEQHRSQFMVANQIRNWSYDAEGSQVAVRKCTEALSLLLYGIKFLAIHLECPSSSVRPEIFIHISLTTVYTNLECPKT